MSQPLLSNAKSALLYPSLFGSSTVMSVVKSLAYLIIFPQSLLHRQATLDYPTAH